MLRKTVSYFQEREGRTAGIWVEFVFFSGRVPCVLPLAWEDAWPVIGMDGKAPRSFEVLLPLTEPKPLVISDEFDLRR